MRLRDLVIGVLIFSGITVGISIFYETLATEYYQSYPDIVGTYSSNKTFATYNRTEEVVNITKEIESKIADIAQPFDITTIYDSFVLAFNFFSLLLKIPSVVIGTFYDAMAIISIPGMGWFTTMVSTVILVIIIFTIAGLFLKGKV